MDGLEDSGAMVLLATNRPDGLDAAVVRDGRVDRRVRVERPSLADSEVIANIYLKDKPSKEKTTDLASVLALEIFRDDRVVQQVQGPKGKTLSVTVADMVSGALIASAVDQAATHAMMRDVKSSVKKPSGLNLDDITWAIDQIQTGMAHIDCTDAFLSKLEQPAS
jgi:proteasome-associated ATPase